jgi:hypothetical protein
MLLWAEDPRGERDDERPDEDGVSPRMARVAAAQVLCEKLDAIKQLLTTPSGRGRRR